jgi:beta-glucosidase
MPNPKALSRRHVLAGLTATVTVPAWAARAADPVPDAGSAAAAIQFPADFLWGVSTSATQIEGAVDEDGRGPSIWDAFAAEPGRIADGSTPRVACDHYHRWRLDIDLMRDLGIGAYRFSISWPRLFADGAGPVNPRGLDFYDRLVDGLLEAGIRPMPCLYHWDLPLALHRAGGWMGRDVADHFANYAAIACRRLGDRAKTWFALNEPSVVAIFGYGKTSHAPGLGGGLPAALAALHHQNLAQGKALRALRAERSGLTLGTVLSLQPVVPDSDSEADRQAAIRWDALWNRVALDGAMRGTVPDVLASAMAPLVRPGDLETIRYPIDLLGMNYYSRMTVRAQPGELADAAWGTARAKTFTAMGWPVEPEGLAEMALELKRLYGNPRVMITENGAAYDDHPDSTGHVADAARIAFLRDHLIQVARARAEGCRIEGYLVWSLLDNFEWAEGYSRRFGLVRVDFPTERRTPKDSFQWYRSVARGGRLAPV